MSHTKFKSLPKPSRNLPKGFTLIELIVVITILAILGTIGFLSIGGYSSKARDSARIGDTAQISKSLDVSIITRGTYPTPDNAFSVTYSGGVVWYQGTVSSGVIQAMKSSIAGGGLNKKPTDPLDNSEYTYSSLAYGKAYQIKMNYEGDLNQIAWNIGTSSMFPEASAAPGSPTIAYIKGNYGGLMAKTVTGSITYILAVPSIITSTGAIGNVLSINGGALSGSLLFHGKLLKNASTYNPTTVVFSGASLPTSDATGEISTMMNTLKAAYAGATDIASNQNIATLLNTTTTGSLVTLGSSVITGQLGGSAVSESVGGGATTSNLIRGEQLYTTPGSFSWTVPSGVTSVSVVCVGGGGGGYDASTISNANHGAGGGGGLGYKNNIAVISGNSFIVQVGIGGSQLSRVGQSGGDSFFNNVSTVRGMGGGGGTITAAGLGGSFIGTGGGNGGNGYYKTSSSSWHGGGGAGGYSGNGGAGGISSAPPTSGAGGGGGGGNHYQGGGVGIYGIGANGAAGDSSTYVGIGGSGGQNGSNDNSTSGNFGAGGGGNSGYGSKGACRIIWPGDSRQFPSTDVGA